MKSISGPFFVSRGIGLVTVVVIWLAAGGVAAEIQVHSMTGILHAVAGSPCPPDGGIVREDLLTEDLTDCQVLAQADTASACGAATALATLTTSITADAISATLTAATNLEDHRSSSGSSYFMMEFHVTAPAAYTLTATGASSSELDPGVMGLGLYLSGVYEVHVPRPDFSEDLAGILLPGIYFLEGSCSVSRAAADVGGGVWVFETGQSEVLGSVILTFTDATVVATQEISLGSLKALYR